MTTGCNGCESRGIVGTGEQDIRISQGYAKLPTSNWLSHLPDSSTDKELVEIQFKSTRKEYFKNSSNLPLKKGDIVAVESNSGHDIGTISLTGKLVTFQLKKKRVDLDRYPLKNIYRIAKQTDIDRWKKAIEMEIPTMIRGRKIISEIGLEMKLGDVEYQGDGSRAIFYYIAEGRIDFRELIKILATEFKIRIEMKQIGARQEAGRIGGIGSCGRELCCSSWKTNFTTVSLNAAKIQDLPPNVQKLAGQCGKLKCCLMYELDSYLEARETTPTELLELETEKGIAYHHKTDILRRIMYYSYNQHSMETLIPVPIDRVKEIINLNKRVTKVKNLTELEIVEKKMEFVDITQSSDLNRFDKKNKEEKPKKRRTFRDQNKK